MFTTSTLFVLSNFSGSDFPPQAVTKNAVGIITNDASKSPAVLLLKKFLFIFFLLIFIFRKVKEIMAFY